MSIQDMDAYYFIIPTGKVIDENAHRLPQYLFQFRCPSLQELAPNHFSICFIKNGRETLENPQFDRQINVM